MASGSIQLIQNTLQMQSKLITFYCEHVSNFWAKNELS